MISVIISGCNGQMGQVLSKAINESKDFTVVAGVSRSAEKFKNNYPVYTKLQEINYSADVIIDFSHPSMLKELLEYAIQTSTALVIATTGFSQEQKQHMLSASNIIPIFYSPNMSLGVNLTVNLVQKAAAVLKEQFDIEIVEKHHNRKVDAPSGTALMIAEKINEVFSHNKEFVYQRHTKRKARENSEIGIYSIRGGTIVGEHSIIFAGKNEIVEIKHQALSKEIFALGALQAAKFILQKNYGYYGMEDLLKE